MNKRLFVGNLPYDITSQQLNELFSQYGKVESAEIITDKYSGRSKGFAFVQMSTEEEAKNAMGRLNGYEFNGRQIVVNEAKPRDERNTPAA